MNKPTTSPRDASPKSPPISLRKKLFFVAIICLLPILLLAVIEGVLRLSGFGGNVPTFRNAGPVEGGQLFISDQEGAISWFFANRDRPGYNDQYHFVEPKASNVFRVFTVGESAMKGFPQPRNLASTAFLQAMLQDAWPKRRVEVVNLGTTAVASYPVLGMMTDALEHAPDLIVIYTGHNEFFGTYGVASIGRAGGKPWMLGVTRFVHSLAMVQGWKKLTTPKPDDTNLTLMERMVGRAYVAPDDWSRAAAANNLHHNVREMIRRCQARGVPVLVCTMPSNERDLAPIGQEKPGDVSARSYFQTAQSLYVSNRFPEALALFKKARDLDTMPWRATSTANDAIRRAATELNAPLCDVEGVFQTNSPGGAIGWELMDDHVHPTLRGQSLIAEAIVQTLSRMTGAVAISADSISRIKSWQSYTEQLGDNRYDRYAVAHMMRVIFDVPFMRETNPDAAVRFSRMVSEFERNESPEMLAIMREYQTVTPHAGGKRPITGMVGRQLMREKKFDEAMKYYEIARIGVPEYTSWHMEYVYFWLVCREKVNGKLDEHDRKLAASEIEQGKFLLRRGFSQTGFTERYTGRFHQLRGEFAEAIPFLNASREKLSGFDLVAADQALFTSYMQTGRFADARALAENGVANSGQYAGFYRQMMELLAQKNPAPAVPE
jgi:lysophospholipase L1-like esterase